MLLYFVNNPVVVNVVPFRAAGVVFPIAGGEAKSASPATSVDVPLLLHIFKRWSVESAHHKSEDAIQEGAACSTWRKGGPTWALLAESAWTRAKSRVLPAFRAFTQGTLLPQRATPDAA